jgi:hypothetical protein
MFVGSQANVVNLEFSMAPYDHVAPVKDAVLPLLASVLPPGGGYCGPLTSPSVMLLEAGDVGTSGDAAAAGGAAVVGAVARVASLHAAMPISVRRLTAEKRRVTF